MLIRHGVFAGSGIALGCLAVGVLGLLSGAPFGPDLMFLGVGLALGWGVTWTVYVLTVSRPLVQLIDSAVSVAESDTAALSDTMAAIAEGDLTGKVAMRAKPLALSAASEVMRLGDGLGECIARLHESAAQLNSMTDEPCKGCSTSARTGTSRGRRRARP